MHLHPEKGESLAPPFCVNGTQNMMPNSRLICCNWWDVVINCCVKQCGMTWQHTKALTDQLLTDEPPRP